MVEGQYHRDFRKVVYSIEDDIPLRTSETYRRHLETAADSGRPVYGIKGPSGLSDILRIPDQIPFDPMHLLYIGINKSLLNAIMKYKLANMETLSSFIDAIKVPHYFRRKPRRFMTEYGLWKAQEHRHFLLFFAPFVFLDAFRNSLNDDTKQLYYLFHLLSTAVYLLYGENISESDICAAEICIGEFQRRLVVVFGESVKTVTLHALRHLPAQVRNFGPLSGVSAMPFENLNRQLKQSVTGTRGTAAAMVHRYLLFQSVSEKKVSYTNVPQVLGNSQPFKRFRVGHLVFHTFDYGRTLKSASYFAYLSDLKRFVKVRGINFHSHTDFSIVCRNYDCTALSNMSDLLHLPQQVFRTLRCKSPFFILTKGDVEAYAPSIFSHHALIIKLRNSPQHGGVKILNTFEHD